MNYLIITKRFACILLVGATVFSSCKKSINLAPEDATYDQVFWATGSNVEKAVSGAYGLLRNALRTERSHFIFGDFTTDQFWRGGDYWNYADLSYNGNNHFSYVPYLEGAVWDWTRFYGLINQGHLIVENAASIPESKFTGGLQQKNQFIGEGHFLRAYAYFYMTRVWGDAVLTKEALKDPMNIQPIARSTENTVLDYCIEDLKKASAIMQFNRGTSQQRIHADKGAAWALLAHVYAWKHDYANAKKYCDSVLLQGGYSLEPVNTYDQIWKGNSNESIFEIQFDRQKLNSFYPMFRSRPRYLASSLVTDPDNGIYQADLQNTFNKDIRGDGAAARFGDGLIWKYIGVDDNSLRAAEESYAHWIVYRYADILLMKAEALALTGKGQDAIDLINRIRQRGHALAQTARNVDPANTEELCDYILEERAREFAFEGKRWYDILRHAKRSNYKRMDLLLNMVSKTVPGNLQQSAIAKFKDPNSHYFPIYQYELQTDKNLVQNPFYK